MSAKMVLIVSRIYTLYSSYGNTVQEDLWAALQEQADEESVALPVSVKTIMDTWTRQMGYPVVNVTRLYDPTNGAYVTQVKAIFLAVSILTKRLSFSVAILL